MKMLHRYITGSDLFFHGREGFTPHDVDYCELWDDLPDGELYRKDEKANWDVYQWKKMKPEEYIDFALKNCTPWQICQFLTPGFCIEVGFTVEDLKKLKPLRDSLYEKHLYQGIIYDGFIENGDWYLKKEQLDRAFELYKEKRKYDWFFNKN